MQSFKKATHLNIMAPDNQRLESLEEQNNKRETARRWLRSKQIKHILGISETTLQKLRKGGVLPFFKLGGTIFYDYDKLINFLTNKTNEKA